MMNGGADALPLAVKRGLLSSVAHLILWVSREQRVRE